MARLTGYVEINGIRAALDWTITEKGIIEGAGLSSAGVVVVREALSLLRPQHLKHLWMHLHLLNQSPLRT